MAASKLRAEALAEFLADWETEHGALTADEIARLRASRQHGLELRTNAMVVAQVWRDHYGRQAHLSRLLQAVDVRAVSQRNGRDAGALLAVAGSANPIDATVVLLAMPGDRILASDPRDLSRLTAAAGNRAVVVTC